MHNELTIPSLACPTSYRQFSAYSYHLILRIINFLFRKALTRKQQICSVSMCISFLYGEFKREKLNIEHFVCSFICENENGISYVAFLLYFSRSSNVHINKYKVNVNISRATSKSLYTYII
jgi:hypothetical protein